MTYWAWWAVALGLVSAALGHWFLTSRMLAVSGAFTAIVNRLRHGKPEAVEWSQTELMAAIAEATQAEFDSVPVDEAAPQQAEHNASELPRAARSVGQHGVFLLALALGGALSAVTSGHLRLHLDMASPGFEKLTGGNPWLGACALLVGGMLVGAGTRMAGGCTTGHGLCGVSRFQPGSLVATCVFFATGILTALLIGSFV